jgi:LUD domain
MSTTDVTERFTSLPDDETIAATVVALEEHGSSVEVVDDLDAAREAVLARIPEGSSVMTNTSVTLDETGIADAINDGGQYVSLRKEMLALDFETQAQEMKAIAGPARLLPRERPRGNRRGSARHRLGLRQPARLLRLGGRQRHLRRRRAEARPHVRRRPRAHLRAQPEAGGRAGIGRVRAEQRRRQDPRDPPGATRAHPRRPHSAIGGVLREPLPRSVQLATPHTRSAWGSLGSILTTTCPPSTMP